MIEWGSDGPRIISAAAFVKSIIISIFSISIISNLIIIIISVSSIIVNVLLVFTGISIQRRGGRYVDFYISAFLPFFMDFASDVEIC